MSETSTTTSNFIDESQTTCAMGLMEESCRSTEVKQSSSCLEFINVIAEDAFNDNTEGRHLNIYTRDVTDDSETSNQYTDAQHQMKRFEKTTDQKELSPEFYQYTSQEINAFRPGTIGTFLWEAFTIGKWRGVDRQTLVQRAAQGLIEEGTKLGNWAAEASWMADQLLRSQNRSREEIWYHCVYLYTRDSFLYRRLNEVLRSVNEGENECIWKRALPTLGLFAWFLFDYPLSLVPFTGRVYRGLNLPNHKIAQLIHYSKTGQICSFQQFASTSRNRCLAEIYGSTLLIIDVCSNNADVMAYSCFSDEEDVLLNPSFTFEVTSVEFNSGTKKHQIYLQDSNC